VLAQRRDLRLQLVDAATVAHVLREVVETVPPVENGSRDQKERQRDEDDRPQRYAAEVEYRPADVDRAGVAVGEDGSPYPDREAKNEGGGENETLPEMAQVGHGRKVTPPAPWVNLG